MPARTRAGSGSWRTGKEQRSATPCSQTQPGGHKALQAEADRPTTARGLTDGNATASGD
ncbi:hypothetical protein [Erwinia pyrifoliae]|uniref:Uncharacterized protein n=1 Tax=Erwinia pyrifoliae TaxID=79967 RepID=A0ABY5X715_ERWPY|nr:hypothetical protein [Erwinia pyrifoliae]UWS33180.1 hypothetical protein NYP84_16550 [Erwinia pyrifoliae]